MDSKPKYTILQEYVKLLDFKSPAAPESFFMNYEGKSTLSTQIDVESQTDVNTGIFCVTLKLKCSVMHEDGNSLFLISVVYGAIVKTCKSLEDYELKSLLTIEIPQIIYPHVAVLVHSTTSFSGFNPVILPNYSFLERRMIEGSAIPVNEFYDIDQYEESRNACFEDEPDSILTLKKLLVDVESEEAGKEFLETLKRSGGEISGFTNFTLTRTLFKYLSFIDYNTTHEIDQDLYAKHLMFFLIVASNDCEWCLVNENGEKPELFYRYKGTDVDKKISDLSPVEFFSLAGDLIVNVLTESYVNIFLIEQEFGTFEELSNLNPSREEYRNAFHYDALSVEQQEFVDILYDEISNTKLEAFTIEL